MARIRIAPMAALQKEEQDRRKLQEEKQLAGDLADYTKRISYAKADTLSEVLKKAGALSQRGQINVDMRTNTLIIRDLPTFIEKARGLIGELDTATPQVEIEARIIVTNRNFTRDIGIQWGLGAEATQRFGNTTNRTFPNSYVLNGGAVPNTLGIPSDMLGPGGLSSAAGIGQATRGYMVNLPASSFNTGVGLSMGNILGSFNLDLAITALEKQGRTRLLSSPKVTTQNNQAARPCRGGRKRPIMFIPTTPKDKNPPIIIKADPTKVKRGHQPHLSGAGVHDNRPKRLRTRSSQLRAALRDTV